MGELVHTVDFPCAVARLGQHVVDRRVVSVITRVAREFTAVVGIGGHFIPVACLELHASHHLVLVAHAVAVHVVQAIAVAIDVVDFWVLAGAVLNGRVWVKVARLGVGAAFNLVHVADAVVVGVFQTISPAHVDRVELVAVAIAIAVRDVGAAALVDRTRAVANPARIEHAHALVHVVANAVHVFVGGAASPAHPKHIDLVAIAIAISFRNVRATTRVNGTRAVAHAAFVLHADTRVEL